MIINYITKNGNLDYYQLKEYFPHMITPLLFEDDLKQFDIIFINSLTSSKYIENLEIYYIYSPILNDYLYKIMYLKNDYNEIVYIDNLHNSSQKVYMTVDYKDINAGFNSDNCYLLCDTIPKYSCEVLIPKNRDFKFIQILNLRDIFSKQLKGGELSRFVVNKIVNNFVEPIYVNDFHYEKLMSKTLMSKTLYFFTIKPTISNDFYYYCFTDNETKFFSLCISTCYNFCDYTDNRVIYFEI